MEALKNIKLIVAIGNPGPEFESTQHNAGKLFVNHLLPDAEWQPEKLFDHAEVKLAGRKFIAARSNVFMNQSGVAAKAAMKKFSLKPAEVLVAQDDSDIEFGRFKFSYDSRSAGHKGIDSVIASFKTQKFPRLRIGIRKKKGKALDFVLKKFSRADLAVLETVFDEAKQRLVNEA